MGAQNGPLPPPREDDAAPPAEAGLRCRKTANTALRAFIDLMEEAAVDGWVSLAEIRRIGNAVMGAGGPLAASYVHAETACVTTFELLATARQRIDHLGRLITARFAHLFGQPASGIERKHLPQFFAAMRMILGEEDYEALKWRATAAVNRHRGPDGLVDWEACYASPEATLVVEQVLVALARSFRRFEPRCDWFLILMNSNPSSVSLGSNAFVPKKAEDKLTRGFTEIHMVRLFEALFAEMRPERFDAALRAGFIDRWQVEPEKIFGPLFVELRRLGNQVGI